MTQTAPILLRLAERYGKFGVVKFRNSTAGGAAMAVLGQS